MDQSELAKAISAQNGNLNVVNKSLEALDAENRELKARVLDLEQKGAHKPGDGPSDDDVIMPAIEASEQFKLLLRGEIKSARITVDAKALHRKAVITSTITGGTIGAPDRSARITAPAEQRMRIRDLLPSVPTDAGSTQFVREFLYTNNAAPQYDTSSPTPGQEGATKPASDMSFELVTSPVTTIAHHFTVSRQALDDSAALRQHLESRGLFGLALEEDGELLNGTGTNGELTGLIPSAAAFTGGGTNQTRLDTLRKAITQIAVANHVASGIVLHPIDAESIELAKDGEQRYMAMVIYVNGQPFVWRLPIIETTAIAVGTFLVGDFPMAATIRDRAQATVEISLDHLDYRTRNLALLLIEMREGLEIHRPIALVTGSLATPG